MSLSLDQILKAKEARVQKRLELNKRWNSPLVCFTVNIPGPCKVTPASRILFQEGVDLFRDYICRELVLAPEGEEAFFSVENPERAKEYLQNIEERHPLGRLFDFDVYTKAGEKLSRNTPRKCFLCENDWTTCLWEKKHSLDEFLSKVNDLVFSFLGEKIKLLAKEALLAEVWATPKPGLVDQRNNGSHQDMTFETFQKSTHAISYLFQDCVSYARNFEGEDPKKFFQNLRGPGVEAEKKMYEATGGVNTHKGLIFLMGLISASTSFLYLRRGIRPSSKEICLLIKEMTNGLVQNELGKENVKTAGEKIYLKHRIDGIRGQVTRGLPLIRDKTLPYLTSLLKNRKDLNISLLKTLLILMMEVDDTNIIKRGGLESLKFMQENALRIFNSSFQADEDFVSEMEQFDDLMIEKHLSPGGCADLLAVTYMLYLLDSWALSESQ